MSTAITARATVRAFGLRAMAARLVREHARRRAERLAVDQLRAMSDRQLADLGIHRGQIDAVVRGLVQR